MINKFFSQDLKRRESTHFFSLYRGSLTCLEVEFTSGQEKRTALSPVQIALSELHHSVGTRKLQNRSRSTIIGSESSTNCWDQQGSTVMGSESSTNCWDQQGSTVMGSESSTNCWDQQGSTICSDHQGLIKSGKFNSLFRSARFNDLLRSARCNTLESAALSNREKESVINVWTFNLSQCPARCYN
jgi:hypothetical protein